MTVVWTFMSTDSTSPNSSVGDDSGGGLLCGFIFYKQDISQCLNEYALKP